MKTSPVHRISPIITPAGPTPAASYAGLLSNWVAPDAHAFPFWSRRTALSAILNALGLGPGHEVIIPALTCEWIVNVIADCGARPVYADLAPGSYALDLQAAADAITARTRALIVQHTFGMPGPIAGCVPLAAYFGISVIEDCSQALGSALLDRPLGSIGDAAFFSSQESGSAGSGWGGAAVTRDPELAQDIQEFYNLFPFSAHLAAAAGRTSYSGGPVNGTIAPGRGTPLGRKPAGDPSRLSAAQNRVGLQAMNELAQTLAHRRMLAETYDCALLAAGWPVLARPEGTSLLCYPLRVINKTELLRKARLAWIEIAAWFDTPLTPAPLQDYFRLGYVLGNYPNAERAAAEVIGLPLHPWIGVEEAERTIDFILNNAFPVRSL